MDNLAPEITMYKGEKWHCANPGCQAEIVVTGTSKLIETEKQTRRKRDATRGTAADDAPEQFERDKPGTSER